MAALGDLGAPAPFEGFVNNELDASTLGHKSSDQEEQQAMAEGERHPARTVEDVMKAAEGGVLRMTGEAQGSGDGASSARQEGADDKERSLVPGRLGKAGLKVGEDDYNSVRKGHRSRRGASERWSAAIVHPVVARFLPWLSSVKMYKVELRVDAAGNQVPARGHVSS